MARAASTTPAPAKATSAGGSSASATCGGGLTRWAYGENIAWGADWRGSPAAIVEAWMDSPPHRANILNRSFREVGVGFDTGTPGGDRAPGGIYTVDFGLRVD